MLKDNLDLTKMHTLTFSKYLYNDDGTGNGGWAICVEDGSSVYVPQSLVDLRSYTPGDTLSAKLKTVIGYDYPCVDRVEIIDTPPTPVPSAASAAKEIVARLLSVEERLAEVEQLYDDLDALERTLNERVAALEQRKIKPDPALKVATQPVVNGTPRGAFDVVYRYDPKSAASVIDVDRTLVATNGKTLRDIMEADHPWTQGTVEYSIQKHALRVGRSAKSGPMTTAQWLERDNRKREKKGNG